MKIYNQYQYSYPHKTNYKKIEKEEIIEELKKVSKGDYYVHLPFCSTKCGYCNLFSTTGYVKYIDKYLDAVERQFKQIESIQKIQATSLILGGGTPNILSIPQLKRLIKILKVQPKNLYSVIELSPNEVEEEKIKFLKEVGFKRVSLGIQSLNEEELKFLKRFHLPKKVHESLKIIEKENFQSFNVDLIYGIENQTKESLGKTLEEVLKYKISEIFIYPLYVRENTYLYGKYTLDEEHTKELYDFLKEYLIKKGYTQTSMRRFVKEKEENISTCGFENSIAFGCGGRTYINNLHYCEKYSDKQVQIKEIINDFMNKKDFLEGLVGARLNQREMKHRFILKNLLHYNSLKIEDYKKYFSKDIYKEYKIFKEKGLEEYINYNEKEIKLKNFDYSDCIIDKMIEYEGENNEYI